jgi:hypothetical protein
LFIINKHDERWMEALRMIGKTIKPNRVVAFIKEPNGNVDALATLQRFFEHFGLEEKIHEKFIANKNLDLLLCGCVYKEKHALHLCEHHGPCTNVNCFTQSKIEEMKNENQRLR